MGGVGTSLPLVGGREKEGSRIVLWNVRWNMVV